MTLDPTLGPEETIPGGTRLIASDRVEGTDVYSRDGERLGEIKRLMIDKVSGQVAYAVMSFGGFLGIGAECHALPWPVLDYDPGKGGYVIGLDRPTLAAAPTFDPDGRDPFREPGWESKVYSYYGLAYPFA